MSPHRVFDLSIEQVPAYKRNARLLDDPELCDAVLDATVGCVNPNSQLEGVSIRTTPPATRTLAANAE